MNLEYNLIFLTEAELELKALITRYNIIQEGLGDKVYEEILKNLDYLKQCLLYLLKNIKILGYYTQRNIKMAVYYIVFEEEMTVLVYSF